MLQALLTFESRSPSCLSPEELKAESFENIACRFCCEVVLKKSITHVFPLPSAHWGELVDHWMCEECNMNKDWALTLTPVPKPGRLVAFASMCFNTFP